MSDNLQESNEMLYKLVKKQLFYQRIATGCIAGVLLVVIIVAAVLIPRINDTIDHVNETLMRVIQADVASVLIEIQSMLPNAISFADMPSCRPLLGLTKDLFISGLKQLSDNKNFRTFVDVFEVGVGISEEVRLGKLFRFYNHYVEELERAVDEEKWMLTKPEQWLLLKSRAERAYSYQLMIKHGFTIAKDVAEVMQNVCVEDDIRQYEALPQLNAVVI